MDEVVKELDQFNDSTKEMANTLGNQTTGQRHRRRSAGDLPKANVVSAAAYPRPSASPLFTK